MNSPEKSEKIGVINLLKMGFDVVKLNFLILPVATATDLITGIFENINPVMLSYIYSKMIDGIIHVANENSSLDTKVSFLEPLIIVYILINLFSLVSDTIGNYFSRIFAVESPYRLSRLLYTRLEKFEVKKFEEPEFGNKVFRAKEALSLVSIALYQIVTLTAYSVKTIIVGILIFVKVPYVVLLLVLLSIPRAILYNENLRKDWEYIRSRTEDRRKASEIVDTLVNPKSLQEIKIFNSYKFFDGAYFDFFNDFAKTLRRLAKQRFTIEAIIKVLSYFVLLWGIINFVTLVLKGKESIGSFTFFMSNIGVFFASLSTFSSVFTAFSENMRRVSEVLFIVNNKEKEADGSVILSKMKKAPLIEIKNMSFTYPRAEKQVLKNINLVIRPGEKIAIVGHNGAGKTTLVKLLARFYNPNIGLIFVDKVDLQTLKISTWYQNFGILFQDYNTYEYLSAADNIQLGDIEKEVSKSNLLDAATKADAIDFINKYKDGFDQVLSEKYKGGVRPSTGQWQKIAIARFLFRNSPVLIFDEPTASIDAVSESKIFSNIYNHFEGKTVIIISHRFSTVRNADRIIVFEEGRIVEEGSHEELIKKGGVYAKSFKLQAEGYK